MSQWEEYDMTARVTAILSDFRYDEPHSFGQPFLSVYQISLEFKRRYPEDFEVLGYKIGGIGSGERFTLPTYIARELSRQIMDGRILNIEGAWLSSHNIDVLTFGDGEGGKFSGKGNSKYDFSLFRLREN